MPQTVTTAWDPAEHLETEEDMAAYLEAALEEGVLLLSLPPWAILPAPRA